MRKHPCVNRVAVILVLLLLAQMLVSGVSLSAAKADSSWPVTLASSNSADGGFGGPVLTHGDGSLSIENGGFQTYSQNGTLASFGHNGDGVLATPGASTAGRDGTLYVNYRISSNNSTSAGIEAYKNGIIRWKYSFSPACGSEFGYAYNPIISYDGNLFVVIAWYCQNAQLVKISTGDGSLIWSQSLASNMSSTAENHIWATPNGVRVMDGNVLKTFDQYGVQQSTQNIDLASDETLGQIASNAQGDVYVETVKQDSTCTYSYVPKVLRLNVDGSSSAISVPPDCIVPRIMRTTPDGGVVLYSSVCPWNVCQDWIYSLASDSTLRYSINAQDWSGYSSVGSGPPVIDSNGDAYFERYGRQNSGDHDYVTALYKVTPGGIMQEIFNTAPLGTDGVVDNIGLVFGQYNQLSNGSIYFTVCNACDSSHPAKLYRLNVAGLTIDYPRSSVLTSLTAKLNYVALGDSFSSGTDSSNGACGRSSEAYPVLLDRDSQANLNLTAFRACMGATTDSVVHGSNGEPGQLDSLGSNTQVVTITVGGNDVDFVDYATACVTDYCGIGTPAYNTIEGSINSTLGVNLVDLYPQILAKAPNAEIYVVSYPRVTPILPNARCPYLNEAGSATEETAQGDAATARKVVNHINEVTLNSVDSVKQNFHNLNPSRLHYVDVNYPNSPFEGHDLCAELPYFNNLQLDTKNIFHPNADGHVTLASIIASQL